MIPFDWPAFLWRMVGMCVTVGSVIGLSYCKGHKDGFNELRADWDAQQLTQQREYITKLRDQGEQIQMLQQRDHERQETYESRLRTVSAQRDAARASLRNRPERAAVPGSCGPAEAAAGTAGSIVYRADAEVLISIAARADELRAALERCQGGDVALEGTRMDH